jgi:hypothetical protein
MKNVEEFDKELDEADMENNATFCEVCGEDPSRDRVWSRIEVCQSCYEGVKELARVREQERDVYRAALADLVHPGRPRAWARAIAVLKTGKAATDEQATHECDGEDTH